MLRNAVGNLSLTEALVALGILALAARTSYTSRRRVFRYGALEYTRRLSLKEILFDDSRYQSRLTATRFCG